jgi:1,6-anhydro-N-acetylmuramate kinase
MQNMQKNIMMQIDFVGFHGQTIFHDPVKKILQNN